MARGRGQHGGCGSHQPEHGSLVRRRADHDDDVTVRWPLLRDISSDATWAAHPLIGEVRSLVPLVWHHGTPEDTNTLTFKEEINMTRHLFKNRGFAKGPMWAALFVLDCTPPFPVTWSNFLTTRTKLLPV